MLGQRPQHDVIDSRFQMSYHSGGTWQNLETSLVVHHDPQSGERSMGFPIDENGDPSSFHWQSNGVSASPSPGPIKEGDPRTYLIVKTAQIQNHDLLTDLVVSLEREGVENPGDVIDGLKARQRWWGEPPQKLTDTAATGLFGELFFLCRWLSIEWRGRVDAWDGPRRSLNDFNWPDERISIEVKTTSRDELPLIHTISSPTQLSVAPGHRLILYSLCARRDPGGEESLTQLVEEISLQLAGEPESLAEFNDKLFGMGYRPGARGLEEHRFRLSRGYGNLYHVDDEFPRLRSGRRGSHEEVNEPVDSRIAIGTYRITMTGLERQLLEIELGVSPVAILNNVE